MQSEQLIIAVNARFLSRPASGVDRVAIELIVAMAQREDVVRLDLLYPKGAFLHADWLRELPSDLRAKLVLRPCGPPLLKLRGHLWEQVVLPFAAGRLLLLSLCSTGPLMHRNQVVMIHDAQVWDAPQSFSRAFRLLYRLLLPRLARRVRHVWTVSGFSRRRLEDLGIAPAGKPRVLPLGADHVLRVPADPDTLNRYGLSTGGYILAIGNLAPHKNLARLLEAASARPSGAPELIVAGGLDTKVFVDARLLAPPGCRLIGRVSDAELRALYEGAVALVFPSVTEGFGLPPIEAMICGCPVLATTGGAVPEVCGTAAIFVDPEDTKGWTDVMARIAADPELRTELAARGRKHADAYRWAFSVETLVSLLRTQKD